MKDVPRRLPDAGRLGDIALWHRTPGVHQADVRRIRRALEDAGYSRTEAIRRLRCTVVAAVDGT